MVINNLSGFDSICGSRSNLGCLKITEYHGKPLQLLFTDSEWLILPDFHGGIGAAFFVQVAILHHGPVERRMLLECSCPSLGTPETWFSRQQLDSSQLWKKMFEVDLPTKRQRNKTPRFTESILFESIKPQALNFNVHSVMVIRDADSSFSRMSAVASLEWSRISSLRVIGPTVSWCNLWSIYTKTCSLQGTVCRCGKQSEFDALNYKYRVDSMASFYEVCESLVVEDGHVTNGNLSPSLVAFLEGIMEDRAIPANETW